MPYIKQELREELKTREPKTYGELVYVIYKEYVARWLANPKFDTAFLIKSDSAFAYNLVADFTSHQVFTAQEMAYDEFKRRYLDPYEDRKWFENGDVVIE